jgi:hypothetical protein
MSIYETPLQRKLQDNLLNTYELLALDHGIDTFDEVTQARRSCFINLCSDVETDSWESLKDQSLVHNVSDLCQEYHLPVNDLVEVGQRLEVGRSL